MKKIFNGIAGVYLFILGLFLTLGCILVVLNPSQGTTPQLFINIPFAIALLATGVGLIRRKNWGRIGAIILSIFTIFAGVMVIASVMFMPQTTPSVEAPNLDMNEMKFVMFGVISIFLVIIPAIFLVFYCTKAGKDLFVEDAANGEGGAALPLGIKIIAVFNLFAAFSNLMIAVNPSFPKIFSIGNTIIFGTGANIYFLISVGLCLYVGIGLFKQQKAAWSVCVAQNSVYIILGLINILFMNQETLTIITSHPSYPTTVDMSLSHFKTVAGLGMIVPLIVLTYLFLRKDVFPEDTEVLGDSM